MPWKLTPAAEMIWEQLNDAHREQIRAVLDDLSISSHPGGGARAGTVTVGRETMKVLRIPGQYSVFFKEDGDWITVFDIASRAQIDFLRSPASAPSPDPMDHDMGGQRRHG